MLIVYHIVHKSASEKDIRAAYKRLSKKFHPDKNKEPDAEEKFVEIAHGECANLRVHIIMNFFSVAYEVLSDLTVRFALSFCNQNINVLLRNATFMIDMAKCVL